MVNERNWNTELEGASIQNVSVRSPIVRTYQRRGKKGIGEEIVGAKARGSVTDQAVRMEGTSEGAIGEVYEGVAEGEEGVEKLRLV